MATESYSLRSRGPELRGMNFLNLVHAERVGA